MGILGARPAAGRESTEATLLSSDSDTKRPSSLRKPEPDGAITNVAKTKTRLPDAQANANLRSQSDSASVDDAVEVPPATQPTSPKVKDSKSPTSRPRPKKESSIESETDDLTRIYGLTVSAVRTLEKAGVQNFNDLASRTPDEIKEILGPRRFAFLQSRHDVMARSKPHLPLREIGRN